MTMRIRETIDPNGISAAAAARKYQRYGLTRSTLRGFDPGPYCASPQIGQRLREVGR